MAFFFSPPEAKKERTVKLDDKRSKLLKPAQAGCQGARVRPGRAGASGADSAYHVLPPPGPPVHVHHRKLERHLRCDGFGRRRVA